MSLNYQAVGWNPQKKTYDRVLLLGVLAYLLVFIVGGLLLHPAATFETLLIRALGTAGFLLLTVILCIGPLCRLDPRFLPLLYNRRHLGVVMFSVGLLHGAISIVQFHALGNTNPLLSLLVSNQRVDSLAHFPFQPLGLLALLILFLMAATSHDFWLANLTAPVWKALHMLVYVAFALLVAHVALGVLQAEVSPLWSLPLGLSLVLVFGLHLVAGWSERRLDQAHPSARAEADGFVDVCALGDIAEGRAQIVQLSGERVAVFRYEGKLSAISNACQHQNGPLGEGRVVDGLVVCPWHGYQYKPCTGSSPAPFTEKIPTFDVRLVEGRVLVHPAPHPAGTRVEPVEIPSEEA